MSKIPDSIWLGTPKAESNRAVRHSPDTTCAAVGCCERGKEVHSDERAPSNDGSYRQGLRGGGGTSDPME